MMIVAVILLALVLWEVVVIANNIQAVHTVLVVIRERLDRLVPREEDEPDDESDDEEIFP